MPFELPGVHRAPNIHDHPDIYEVENQAIDPAGVLRATLWELAPWAGRVVLDLGCGTGFHLPRFAVAADHVFAVEPHDETRLAALRRVASLGLTNVSVLAGSAERILLPDASVDVVHSMFAYFLGPGCERGITEVARVLRPAGVHVVIDYDWENGDLAPWLAKVRWPQGFSPRETPDFWTARGYSATPVHTAWSFANRGDFKRVMRIEFAPDIADALCRRHTGTTIDVSYVVYSRHRA